MKKKEGIVGIVLALCLLVALASPALAGGLTVYAGKIESSVSPGKDYSYTMGVQNTSDAPMDIGVEVKGYGMSATADFDALAPEKDTGPYTARDLLAISPTGFHLEPGASQDVKITAKIPAGIGDGGRYAIIFIHTAPKGEMVGTISAVAARVLLTISGSKLDTNSQITEVSLGNTSAGAPTGVLVTVANNGNCHYEPQLQAKLKKGDRVVATTSLLVPGWPIIPGYSRQFQLNFVGRASLPAGKYDVAIEVKDESGNLVAEGTFPLEFIEEIKVLPPAKVTVSPLIPASLTLTPGNASVLETKSTEISVSFPKGAVTGQVGISLQSYPLEQAAPPPAGFILATTCFRIDGLTGLLAKEATVTVKYTTADLDEAGGDASRLRLARWDEANNQWTVLKTKLDKEATTLSTTTNQLSIWAVMVAPPGGTNWGLIGGVAAGVIIIALLVYFLAIKRRKVVVQ